MIAFSPTQVLPIQHAPAPPGPLRDFYAGKACLVTGGRGFIGGALAARLKALGAKVVVLDRHNCDVKNIYQTRGVFDAADFGAVFHLAARTEVRASFSDPMVTYRTNVLGTLNVLEVCRERKVGVVVVASTDKVYGNAGKMSCLENDVLRHDADLYASSKRAADELAQDYARLYGMPIRVLRCANVYGPGQWNATTLITGTLARLLRGERPVVHAGSRHVVREWLYVDDAVDAYLRAGADATPPDGPPVYNVGSREQYSVDAVVGFCLAAFGRTTLDFDLEADTCPQIGDQGLDSTKFRRRFPEWCPLGFAEGLARTIAWHREHWK